MAKQMTTTKARKAPKAPRKMAVVVEQIPTVFLQVRVEPELKEALRKCAAAHHLSMSHYLIKTLGEAIKRDTKGAA